MVTDVLRVYAFVDGAQLREGLEEIDADWRQLNLMDLSRACIKSIGANWQEQRMTVSRVFVYDAVPEEAEKPDDQDIEYWLTANNAEMDIHVRRGRLSGDPRKPKARRQKTVDVQLAVDALTFAVNGVFDVALLITGDGDFAPVAEAIRDKGPLVGVVSFQSRLSPILREVADRIGYLPTDPVAYEGWRLSTGSRT